MTGSPDTTGYVLDELEEPIIPPVAELDVIAPNVPLIIATVVLAVVITA